VNLLRATGEVLRPVLDFIYPPRCPACGDAIGAQAGMCLECWHKLEVPNAPPDNDEYGGVIAATVYGELSRKLVLAYKHGGKIALAPLLAQLIASQLGTPQPSRLIIPVPLHPLRLWRRGYNQSALLAVQLQHLGHGRLIVDGLRRARHTPSLDRRSRAQRAQLLEGAIKPNLRRLEQLRGADILLVDDVLTSGATTDACVSALRAAEARRVTVACFARVGSHGAANVVPRAMSVTGETNARDLVIPGVA
jgi:ComF family protein